MYVFTGFQFIEMTYMYEDCNTEAHFLDDFIFQKNTRLLTKNSFHSSYFFSSRNYRLLLETFA